MNDKDLRILQKIFQYCNEIPTLIEGIDYTGFLDDIKTNRACVLTVEQIGECAKRLSQQFTDNYSYVPWRAMGDMRNRIAHNYDGIYWDIVWEVLTEDIPELTEHIGQIISEVGGSDDET